MRRGVQVGKDDEGDIEEGSESRGPLLKHCGEVVEAKEIRVGRNLTLLVDHLRMEMYTNQQAVFSVKEIRHSHTMNPTAKVPTSQSMCSPHCTF
jgi:hypothetical protein